jgi:uncharacterized protein
LASDEWHEPPPWQGGKDGVVLAVRLTPKGGRDAIDGIVQLADGRKLVQARVRAAPSGGDANAALIRLIATRVGVPPRDVKLAAGTTGRVKRLTIAGDPLTLIAALEKITAAR